MNPKDRPYLPSFVAAADAVLRPGSADVPIRDHIVFRAIADYCERHHLEVPPAGTVRRLLNEIGFRQIRLNEKRVYYGLEVEKR